MNLTKIQTIRFSEDDLKLLNELKKYKIKPHAFIRIALREKLNKDLPEIIKREKYLKSKEYCPF